MSAWAIRQSSLGNVETRHTHDATSLPQLERLCNLRSGLTVKRSTDWTLRSLKCARVPPSVSAKLYANSKCGTHLCKYNCSSALPRTKQPFGTGTHSVRTSAMPSIFLLCCITAMISLCRDNLRDLLLFKRRNDNDPSPELPTGECVTVACIWTATVALLR